MRLKYYCPFDHTAKISWSHCIPWFEQILQSLINVAFAWLEWEWRLSRNYVKVNWSTSVSIGHFWTYWLINNFVYSLRSKLLDMSSLINLYQHKRLVSKYGGNKYSVNLQEYTTLIDFPRISFLSIKNSTFFVIFLSSGYLL